MELKNEEKKKEVPIYKPPVLFKTNEVENHHIFALIVGASGVGKTSLVKTLPHDKTIILSSESGLLSVKDTNIDVFNVKSFEDIKHCYAFIRDSGDKYEHIFIDSLTEIGEFMFAELKPFYDKSKMFGLYDDYSDKMTKLLKGFRDFTKYNIWMTCLDKMVDKDFTQVLSIDLHQKSFAKKIPKLFDEVFHMTCVEHEGEQKRVLITDNSITDFAKDRSGKLNKIELPNLSDICSKIFN